MRRITEPVPRPSMLEREPSRWTTRRLSGSIGVVAEGVRVSDATPADLGAIRDLVTAHQVVFLPGQHLDEHEFTAFASSFGSLAVHPLRTLIGRPQAVSVIEDSPSRPPAGFPWHTDLSWLESPPRFGFLQALDIPDHGGDTMWASMTAAYGLLSPAMQRFCRELSTVHRIDESFRASVERNHGCDVAAELVETHGAIVHPLVRRHPDSGEPSLWLSPLYVDHVVDVMPSESAMLLSHLNALADDPNLGVRWHWTRGDIALWDESCTVHRALVDHHPLGRRMRRCTTAGGGVEAFGI